MNSQSRKQKDFGLLEEATLLGSTKEGLRVHEPRKRLLFSYEVRNLDVFSVGRQTLPFRTYGKVIVLTGANGVGKTTLMSTMLNYMLGVDFEDDERLQMVQSRRDPLKNKSRAVTAYVVHPQKAQGRRTHPITIVDTPGFEETEGLGGDTVSTLMALFQHRRGIDSLHSVGMVVSAATTRWTAGYAQAIQQLQRIFGTDVVNSIHLFVTFADARHSSVQDMVERAGIPHNGTYPVDNRCLFNRNQEKKPAWDETMRSMAKYFAILSDAIPVSVIRTREFLMRREGIENHVKDQLEKVKKVSRLTQGPPHPKDFPEAAAKVLKERANTLEIFISGLETLELLQTASNVLKKSIAQEASQEKLTEIRKLYRTTQLKVHKLIRDSHANLSKLEESAPKRDAFPLIAHIDFLIQLELDEGHQGQAAALKVTRAAAEWMASVRDEAYWDCFFLSLSDPEETDHFVAFEENDSDAQLPLEPEGLLRTLRKCISNRFSLGNHYLYPALYKIPASSDPVLLLCIQQDADRGNAPNPIGSQGRIPDGLHSKGTGRPSEYVLGKKNGYDLCELKKEMVVKENGFGIYHVMKPDTPVTNVGKVVMFVGVTGAGKTSMINSLINYLLGVEFDDEFRFKLIHEKVTESYHSITDEVSAYIVHAQHGSRYPHNLIIIDTPGFGDTRGLQADKELLQKLKRFYDVGKKWNITRIHAVGLVVKLSDCRITTEQKYVFESVLSVFTKEVEPAFVAVVTFADGSSDPPGLKVLKAAGIPYNDVFLVNNSPVFSHCKEGNLDMKRYLWDTNFEKVKLFCDRLESCEDASLDTTRRVLHERLAMEGITLRLQKEVQNGMDILKLLEVTYGAFKKGSAEKTNKDKLKKLGKEFRDVQLKVHKLIGDARASFSKLEEIALKPESVTITEYIELLIRKERDNGDVEKLKALEASRKAAEWLSAMRKQAEWDPFQDCLAGLRKIGLQLAFDGGDCNVQFL
ncbi:unnamed protein product [Darwinula stevensoni]|uniref:AAA+ ATPase domain-containing protein n=1 Tax=Darwinula stevensoni TaxID=69355 RepID=A0A7R8XDA2_9CRUS|nr:unnamed protein product [Darwinula stevensoni]CAG0893304.1 unnamed protein product [Darwinula stevensoni]